MSDWYVLIRNMLTFKQQTGAVKMIGLEFGDLFLGGGAGDKLN